MLKRVVICCLYNDPPQFVFGPFDDHNEAQSFIEAHEKVCKRLHVMRKINPPDVGAYRGDWSSK